MSEVNMAITDLQTAQCGINTRMKVIMYPPLVMTNAGETAIARNVRSIEPRATAAHSLEKFQPAHMIYNFSIALGFDEPIRSLRKNVSSFMMKREHLDLCTNMQRADRVASNAWPSGENRRFRSAGSAGIAARVIVKSMVEGVEMREMSRSIEPKGPFNLPASIGHSDSEPQLSRALYT